MAVDSTPAPIEGWDDLDHAVYEHRIRQHKSLRATAAAVGLSHEGVRQRIRRMMQLATHGEVDEMRTAEGHRLDELADVNWRLVEAAVAVGDLVAAQRGLREIHAIVRSRIQLFGLDMRPDDQPVDAAAINDAFRAYFQGRDDARAAGETHNR